MPVPNNLGNVLKDLSSKRQKQATIKQSHWSWLCRTPLQSGHLAQRTGPLNEAEANYNQAIALKPDYAEAHSNLGNTLKELGWFDEAEANYKQAIALKSDYAEAYSNLGDMLRILGRLDEAEVCCTKQ